VTDADGELIAEVPVAWAYDANGVEVPSRYSIRGIGHRVAAAFCTGLAGGVCAAPWAIAWALIGLGASAIRICRNSRGFDLHRYTGAVWC